MGEEFDRAGGRVALVVEDDPDAATVAQGMLAALGWSCEVAVDGRDALMRAAELRPDAVLLDVFLPGIDGIGVMKVLRRLREQHPVAVIAASAVVGRDSAQARQLTALGVSGFLHKPFKMAELADALHASGLSTGEYEAPSGSLRLTTGGKELSVTSMALHGTVLEVDLAAGSLGAGAGVTLELPSGGSVLGTVFSAVPRGPSQRCRISLADLHPDERVAIARALAR